MTISSSEGTAQFMVPGEKAAPKEGKLPKHFGKINNLAGDEELCEKVLTFVRNAFTHYDSQDQRDKYTDSGDDSGSASTMDLADRMYRAALRRDTSSAQYEKSASDVVSTVYFRAIRAVTSSMNSILLKEGLPAKYEPEINTTEYTAEQGKQIAESQNMLEEYTWDEDKRVSKVRELILFNNKYGQSVVSIEWLRTVDKRIERVPSKFDDKGMPTSFKFEEKERIVADYPTMRRWDMKDVWMDAQIDGFEEQRAAGVHGQSSWNEMASEQSNGQIMNVEKLTPAQLYQQESGTAETLEDRWRNDGSDADDEQTGLFDRWWWEAYLPIKETGDGKGEWDINTPPERYWVDFAGQIEGGAVCLRIIKNPHFDRKSRFKLLHSHNDDNGVYHLGFADLIGPLYWEVTTNMNQAIDNVKLRNRAPMTANGPIHTRDLTYKANKLIRLARNTTLEPIKVPETTQITMAMHDRITDDINDTIGSNDTIRGEALGGRTSANESQNVFDQSMKPIADMTEYFAEQLFPWMYEKDASLWRQYGDPNTVVTITHNDGIYHIKPTELWGPIRTKVTAVDTFMNTAVARRDLSNFIANVAPQFEDVMGPSGKVLLARKAAKAAGLDDVNEMFPEGGDFDARRVATDEDNNILFKGIPDEAFPEENHMAHLSIHEPAERQYALLPTEDIDVDRLRQLRAHIQQHKDFSTQAQQAQAAGAQGVQSDAALQGEILGDQLEAQGGAFA